MDTELETLRARVLYLEGMVAALIALHPRCDDLLDFTPDVVTDTRASRDSAENYAETNRRHIWLHAFKEAELEMGGEVGSAGLKLKPRDAQPYTAPQDTTLG